MVHLDLVSHPEKGTVGDFQTWPLKQEQSGSV